MAELVVHESDLDDCSALHVEEANRVAAGNTQGRGNDAETGEEDDAVAGDNEDYDINDDEEVDDEDESDDEQSEDNEQSQVADRATTFRLNGQAFNFDNPVSLVLAAARQLGMAIGRDAKLLWIADEALLDEHDDEDVIAMGTTVPLAPLSDEVFAHYAELFAQRSSTLGTAAAAAAASSAAASLADAPDGESRAGAEVGSGTATSAAAELGAAAAIRTAKQKRQRGRAERRRRRLALREARLSGISERYSQEHLDPAMSPRSLDSGDGQQGIQNGSIHNSFPSSPHSPSAAVWPAESAISPLVAPMRLSSRASLPRIDSGAACLNLLDVEPALLAQPQQSQLAATEAQQLPSTSTQQLCEQMPFRALPQSLADAPHSSCTPSGEALCSASITSCDNHTYLNSNGSSSLYNTCHPSNSYCSKVSSLSSSATLRSEPDNCSNANAAHVIIQAAEMPAAAISAAPLLSHLSSQSPGTTVPACISTASAALVTHREDGAEADSAIGTYATISRAGAAVASKGNNTNAALSCAPAVAAATTTACVVSAQVRFASFAVGERVEVDFDTEGWFGGVVTAVAGERVHTVALDRGDVAEDVEGSEIRAEIGKKHAKKHARKRDAAETAVDGQAADEPDDVSSSYSGRYAHTRSDALSGFGSALDLAGLETAIEAEACAPHASTPQPSMRCRVDSNGNVVWDFLPERTAPPDWSPPTLALLKGRTLAAAQRPQLASLQDYFKQAEEEPPQGGVWIT